MRIEIEYACGRIDVFDDARFATTAPFGRQAMLVNYELRFDRLGETGIWLDIHHYDAADNEGDEQDATPVARRRRGQRFLLAERGEVADIERIAADGEELAFRMGGDLVDATRFRRAVDAYVCEPNSKSKAQCASELFETLSKMPSAGDAHTVAAEFGFSLASLDAALAAWALSPKKANNNVTSEQSSDDWTEGILK